GIDPITKLPASILTLPDTLDNRKIYNQVNPDDPKNSLVGAYVVGDGIVPGTRLLRRGNLDKLEFVLTNTALTPNAVLSVTFHGKKPAGAQPPTMLLNGFGSGGGPQVTVTFDDGTSVSFFAFPASFTGGTRVAQGDVSGDGFPDIIVGAGPGGAPQVN